MHKQTVVLFHEDPELSSFFESSLKKSDIHCEVSRYENQNQSSLPSSGTRLILLETGKEEAYPSLLTRLLKSDLKKTMVIIGPSKFLKKTVHHIEGISKALTNEGHDDGKPSHGHGREIYMEDFLESKLKAFIKKIYSAKKSNLYNTLLQEFERPLITLALKETKGNQIQAAEILGLNRNTLRKKIQDLKIPVKNLKNPP